MSHKKIVHETLLQRNHEIVKPNRTIHIPSTRLSESEAAETSRSRLIALDSSLSIPVSTLPILTHEMTWEQRPCTWRKTYLHVKHPVLAFKCVARRWRRGFILRESELKGGGILRSYQYAYTSSDNTTLSSRRADEWWARSEKSHCI